MLRSACLQFCLPSEIFVWGGVFILCLCNFQVCIADKQNEESYRASMIFDKDHSTDKDCLPSVLLAQ